MLTVAFSFTCTADSYNSYFRLLYADMLENDDYYIPEVAEYNSGCTLNTTTIFMTYQSTYYGTNSFCLNAGCTDNSACKGTVNATFYTAADIR